MAKNIEYRKIGRSHVVELGDFNDRFGDEELENVIKRFGISVSKESRKRVLEMYIE